MRKTNRYKTKIVNGKDQSIHRAVAEAALGHSLDSKHPVHHVDGDTHNNANNNLVICEDEHYHRLLHRRAKRLRKGLPLDDPIREKKPAVLTDKQEQILAIVKANMRMVYPTIRVIAKLAECSTANAHQHIQALKRKGWM